MSETLEKDLATLMLWQAAAGFADSSKSRTQILRDIDAYMTHYPKSEQLTHALELAATLRKMIVEDEAHAKIEPTDPAALPLNEKIQELIFHLRDDNASWLLSEWRPLEPGPTNLPSGQLISIGYPAIPQLIAALNSNALTRSVIFYQRFRPSDRYYPGMLRLVGDLAEQLVEEITGRDFSIGVSTPASVTADGTASAFKSAAEAWWAEFQKKGEKQMLIDGVATGARDAPTQAERLFKRYPDAATPAVIRGIRAANDSWIRKQLIEQIAKSSDESVAGFLKEEMKSGPDVECRVAAATGLRQRGGRTEALAVMIREWQNLGEQNGADSDDGETVAKFLGGCDSVEAITALEKGLRQHPVGLRYSVIEFLGETNAVLSEPETTTPSAATLAAIEELLVGALDDKGENFGMRTSFNGESVEDPRICDMAGNSLAERWPDRYRFELFSSLKMRERQRIECLNVWRRAHELPALPLPQPRTTKVAPKDATKVTTIEWAAESAKPDKVFEARIASLKDKPLRGSDLVSVFCDFVRKREPGAVGIEIKAIKDEDLTGVQVIVRLIPTPPVTTGQGWSRIERVSIANKNDLGGGSSGSSSPNSYSTPDEWSDFEEAVNKATSAKPEVPFKIEVRLVSRQ
jgi:hypothetical protein